MAARQSEVDNLANAAVSQQDTRFKRRVSWLTLAALTFTGMVGSGWLFASHYAAQMAGPAALVSWLIAAIATALVGLTFIELGVTRPIAGGSARWPSMIAGPFVGIMIGWTLLLQTAFGTPSEASGLLQYASRWWPALFAEHKLSVLGLVIAVIVLILFNLLNWFGVVLMSRASNVVTVFKILVPVLTIIMLIAAGFTPANYETGGGFAPYHSGAMLTALIGAGLIYSFGGIQTAATMAGETERPRRDIPLGTFVGFGAAFAVYILLQTSYLGAVPNDLLAKVGWHGIDFNSPFAQLAALLNMGWLVQLLLIDAVVSPAGSLLLGIGLNGRNTYGLAQNHTLPRWAAEVDKKSGIPRNALLINLAVSILFLLVFQSWKGLVASLGFFFAVGYAVLAVVAGANARDPKLKSRPWLRCMGVVAPIAFALSGCILYWSGWHQVWLSVILFAISIPIAFVVMTRDRKIFTPKVFLHGLWFVAFMAFILVMSAIGSFGGAGWLPQPVDWIIVAVGSVAIYFWGHHESVAWMTSPAAEEAQGVYY